jgi:hypothetical protein
MPYTRDPLAVRFDLPARRLITAAYDGLGDWAGWVLPPPGPNARAWMRSQGIAPYERDRWGELRYVRAFKRSVYWQVKWYGGLYGLRGDRNTASGGAGSHWGAPVRVAWQTGRQLEPAPGQALGAWAVRIKIVPPGGATEAIGRASRERWIDDAGHPTFRQSNPAYGDRPWE